LCGRTLASASALPTVARDALPQLPLLLDRRPHRHRLRPRHALLVSPSNGQYTGNANDACDTAAIVPLADYLK